MKALLGLLALIVAGISHEVRPQGSLNSIAGTVSSAIWASFRQPQIDGRYLGLQQTNFHVNACFCQSHRWRVNRSRAGLPEFE